MLSTVNDSQSINNAVNEWKKKRILHVQIYQFAIQVLWPAMCVGNLSVFVRINEWQLAERIPFFFFGGEGGKLLRKIWSIVGA